MGHDKEKHKKSTYWERFDAFGGIFFYFIQITA